MQSWLLCVLSRIWPPGIYIASANGLLCLGVLLCMEKEVAASLYPAVLSDLAWWLAQGEMGYGPSRTVAGQAQCGCVRATLHCDGNGGAVLCCASYARPGRAQGCYAVLSQTL